MTEQTELLTDNGQPMPVKKKVCKLVWAQLGCVAAIVLSVIILILLDAMDIGGDIEYLLIHPYVFLLAIPFLGIAALIRISLKSEQIKGRLGCFLMIAVSGFLIYTTSYYEVPRASNWPGVERIVCGTNLKGLGTALEVYANDYNGLLPTDWCDRLIEEADVNPRSLTCPQSDSIPGESNYCLNQYAAGKDMEALPDDMVVLFDANFNPAENQIREPVSKRESYQKLVFMREIFKGDEAVYLDRWNQVGGPEMLDYRRHGGCNVLLANGQTRFVTPAEIPSLRWNVEGDVKLTIPEGDVSALQRPGPGTFFSWLENGLMNTLLLSATLTTGAIVIRFGTIKYSAFIMALGVLSTATGWLFGGWSEKAYVGHGLQGGTAGAFFGLLVGLCFAAIMTGTLERTRGSKSFVLLCTATGMLTGVVCSTLVHLGLMIFYEETNAFGVAIGIPFGICAGAVLGCISGFTVKMFYLRNASLQPQAEIINAAQ